MQQVTTQEDSYKYIYKRFEKLAAAFYLVTNHLSDREPLKHTIRQKTISLLETVSDFNLGGYAGSLFTKDKINDECNQIISLLEIASQAGLIMHQNVEIILAENTKIQSTLSDLSQKDGHAVGGALPSTFGYATEQKQETEGELEKDKNSSKEKTKNLTSNSYVKDKIKSYSNGQNGDVKPRKKTRREFIVGVISQKGEVTIKDISTVFKGCSEKTIQRELISLVNEGIVSKEGERRWSKYKLVNA